MSITDQTQDILYRVEDGIAYVTLNRPQKANALNEGMLDAIIEACEEARENDEIKAIVLAANGRIFSGGVDLKVFDPSQSTTVQTDHYLLVWDRMIDAMRSLPKPVICAIQGPAIAGGLSMSLACDIRIASEEASFVYPRVPQGHLPGEFNLKRLVEVIGPSRTRLVLFGARTVSATEAYEWGLVDCLASQKTLADEIDGFVQNVSNTPTPLVVATHQLIHKPNSSEIRRLAEDAVEKRDSAALPNLMSKNTQ